jgi:hypothetical protein
VARKTPAQFGRHVERQVDEESGHLEEGQRSLND